jgi:hypothetical protein
LQHWCPAVKALKLLLLLLLLPAQKKRVVK